MMPALSMRTSSLDDLERKSLAVVLTDSRDVRSHCMTVTGVSGANVLTWEIVSSAFWIERAVK